MDAAVAVALIFAGLALGISIGALLLALRMGGTGAVGGGGSESLHRSYSVKLDLWLNYQIIPYVKKIRDAVAAGDPAQLPDPGITDPPTPPGGGE
jgi:hypothetical protein